MNYGAVVKKHPWHRLRWRDLGLKCYGRTRELSATEISRVWGLHRQAKKEKNKLARYGSISSLWKKKQGIGTHWGTRVLLAVGSSLSLFFNFVCNTLEKRDAACVADDSYPGVMAVPLQCTLCVSTEEVRLQICCPRHENGCTTLVVIITLRLTHL